MAAFPYSSSNLTGGVARALYAPITQALPTKIHDVIDIISPYNPKAGWLDFGAAKGSFTFDRDFETEGWEIQQSSSVIFEEVSEITRSMTLSVSELQLEAQRVIEEALAITTIAAVAGTSTAQRRMEFGNFFDLTQYRMAFLTRRRKGSGLVTEPGGLQRGRWYGGVLYRATIAPDSSELEYEKGQLAEREVTFNANAEPGAAEGAEHGAFLEETAGAI